MILIDSGVIVAAAISTDANHHSCSELITGARLANRRLLLGTTDASVLVLAERLAITEIATTDRRHFAASRATHTDHLTLLPETLG